MRPARAFVLCLSLAAGGCASVAPATVEGECRVFDPPPHVVTARTRSGQRWVSRTTETGVRVCGWPRPGPAPGDAAVPVAGTR